jgi:hypothetical protein
VLGYWLKYDGVDIDLTGAPLVENVFGPSDHNATYENVEVTTNSTHPNSQLNVLSLSANNLRGIVVDGLVINEVGTTEAYLIGSGPEDVVLKNVTYNPATTASPYIRAAIRVNNRLHTTNRQTRILVENWTDTRERPYFITAAEADTNTGYGIDVWYKNVTTPGGVTTSHSRALLIQNTNQGLVAVRTINTVFKVVDSTTRQTNLIGVFSHPTEELADFVGDFSLSSNLTGAVAASLNANGYHADLDIGSTSGTATITASLTRGNTAERTFQVQVFGNEFPVDIGSTVSNAWGVSRLKSDYSGAIARVIRASDSVEADLYLDGDYVTLDSAVENLSDAGANTTLGTFASGGIVRIKYLVCQKGSGINLAGSTYYPQITDATGALRTRGSKASIYFEGTSDGSMTATLAGVKEACLVVAENTLVVEKSSVASMGSNHKLLRAVNNLWAMELPGVYNATTEAALSPVGLSYTGGTRKLYQKATVRTSGSSAGANTTAFTSGHKWYNNFGGYATEYIVCSDSDVVAIQQNQIARFETN